MCSGFSKTIIDPVGALAGDSALGRVHKMVVDPAGLVNDAEGIGPTSLRDPLKYGDAKREEAAQRQKAMLSSYSSYRQTQPSKSPLVANKGGV